MAACTTSRGALLLYENTITDNLAPPDQGSGVASRGDYLTRTEVASSIISGNHDTDVDVVGGGVNSFQSNGFNLVGTGGATAAFMEPSDMVGITSPGLGPLADNGGPTQTHELLTGSAALDRGDPGVVADPQDFDQRGAPFLRVADGGTGSSRQDIGAYELQTPTDARTGDYNEDGVTNLADYVVWRDSLGSTSDLSANGDNSGESQGIVDAADYVFWKADFGNTAVTNNLPASTALSPALSVTVQEDQPLLPPAIDGAFAALRASSTRLVPSSEITARIETRDKAKALGNQWTPPQETSQESLTDDHKAFGDRSGREIFDDEPLDILFRLIGAGPY